MIHYHNKLQKTSNIDMKDFINIVDFLKGEGVISNKFDRHHLIYEFYQDKLKCNSSYEAKQLTITEFNIGYVTFHTIKSKFKDN